MIKLYFHYFIENVKKISWFINCGIKRLSGILLNIPLKTMQYDFQLNHFPNWEIYENIQVFFIKKLV